MKINTNQVDNYLLLLRIYTSPTSLNIYNIIFNSLPTQITLINNNYTFPEAPFAKFYIAKSNISRIIVGTTSVSSISSEFNSSSNITKIIVSALLANSPSITSLELPLMGKWIYVNSSANNLGCNAFFDPASNALRFYKFNSSHLLSYSQINLANSNNSSL